MRFSKSAIYAVSAGVLLCGSSAVVDASKKIERLNSAIILPQSTENRECMSIKEYIQLANKFSDANGIKRRLGDEMKKEYDEYIARMRYLGDIFGYKKYTAEGEGDQPEVISIDLSYPNLERVIKKHIESCIEGWEQMQEEYPGAQFPSTPNQLKWLLKKIDEIRNRPTHSLTDDEMDWFIQALAADDSSRVFKVMKEDSSSPGTLQEDKERFKNTLKNIMKNESGFQRVMSLLLVRVCDQMGVLPFKCYIPKAEQAIRIGYSTAGSTKFIDINFGINFNESEEEEIGEKLKIDKSFLDEDVSIYHEITHAYHFIIGYRGLDEQEKYSWISNFSAINSDKLDLIDIFYPMLKPENMNPVIEELRKLIETQDKNAVIQAMQRTRYLGGIKFRIKAIVKSGFGSFLFGKNFKEEDLKYENLINKFLPEIIYLSQLVLNDGGDGLWNDFEEKITMQGNDVFLSNGRCFIVEDRQHEQIYSARKDNSAKNLPFQKHYRLHDILAPIDIPDAIIKSIGEVKANGLMNRLLNLLPRGGNPQTAKLRRLLSNKKLWEPSKPHIKYRVTPNGKSLSEDEFIYDNEDYKPASFDL